jgi:hypothetical protein
LPDQTALLENSSSPQIKFAFYGIIFMGFRQGNADNQHGAKMGQKTIYL